MPDEYEKVIRDTVYGYIGITAEQRALIELPVFQRLRRISQLSFANLVYPNATQNRFSHSLGVMYLGRIVGRYLKTSNIGEEIGLSDIDYESIVWAGLLHDIGHLPFSHVCEPVFAYFIGGSNDWKDYHVKIGLEIIQSSTFGIKEIIGDEIAKKITTIIDKSNSDNHPLLHEAMTGVCSVDRLDYLKRDAYHAGTPEYAIIDTDRILTSMIHFSKDPYISPIFKKKALYALEGAILSYFYMYRAIYYHHAVRAAYVLFQDIIWDAFEKYELKSKIENLFDPEFWHNFDDHRFLSRLYSIEELHPKLEQLVFRKLPKMIPPEKILGINIMRIYRFIEASPYNEKVSKERIITEELRKKYSELEMVLLDSPVVIPYPRSLFAEKSVYVWGEDMDEPLNVATYAPYLASLQDASEKQLAARIYVYPRNLRENGKFIGDLNSIIGEELR